MWWHTLKTLIRLRWGGWGDRERSGVKASSYLTLSTHNLYPHSPFSSGSTEVRIQKYPRHLNTLSIRQTVWAPVLSFLLGWRTCPYALWIPWFFSSRILLYVGLSSPLNESLSSPSEYFGSSSAHSHLLLAFFPSLSNCLYVLSPFPALYSYYTGLQPRICPCHVTQWFLLCVIPHDFKWRGHLETIQFSHLLHLLAAFDQLATPYFLTHFCPWSPWYCSFPILWIFWQCLYSSLHLTFSEVAQTFLFSS